MKTRLANMLFDAKSLGGIGTTICMPELSVAVDIGFCTPAALRCDTLILTHGHADHVSGLTTWLGTRRLYGMRPGRIIVPALMLPVMERFLEVLGQLQGRPYETEVKGVDFGEEAQITKDTFATPFPVEHSGPSAGWALIRLVRKLDPKYHGLPGNQIAKMKENPPEGMFSTKLETLVAITGDTTAAGLLPLDPLVKEAKVLFVESTFVDDRRSFDQALLGKHSHLDQLLPILEQVQSEAIVLYHFSQIYRVGEIEAAVKERLTDKLASVVHLLLPQEGDRL
ncbi:MAG TPA: MBL fold metallo-hydrolase [Myxococcota bacterium]|nr:MBL fold metallo-hydrolase [Myxococcota bacterium]HON25430.1 MBL fold metallo-hydrolase [Myxococcota bacterium]HOS62810.1 MBL fold metallo-hydrolase [Myxococcota bacterium]HPC91199.1 MBL fold metallo-hydrolase [Myxococcota bacterium]HPL25562.1 MBL fold metallo-hydrolase [Myxococcota bacterium]